MQFVGVEGEGALGEARATMWEKKLRDKAREQFFWVGEPGVEFKEVTESSSTSEECDGGEKATVVPPPPANFLLALMSPTHVDYLRLKDDYREEHYFNGGEEGWVTTRLNP